MCGKMQNGSHSGSKVCKGLTVRGKRGFRPLMESDNYVQPVQSMESVLTPLRVCICSTEHDLQAVNSRWRLAASISLRNLYP